MLVLGLTGTIGMGNIAGVAVAAAHEVAGQMSRLRSQAIAA